MRRSPRSSSPPTRSTSTPASWPNRRRSNAEVKAFGKQMVTDHTGVNKQAVALVTKLKVTPEDNPTSQSLKTGGDENVEKLEEAERRGVRQGLRRPRGRVPPAGARRDRQDADPERAERRAEGAARQGAAGVRRAPRAREEAAGVARQEELSRSRCGASRAARSLRAVAGRRAWRRRPGGRAAAAGRATHEVVIQGAAVRAGDADGAARRRRRLDQQGSVPAHRHGAGRVRFGVDRAGKSWRFTAKKAGVGSLHLHAPPEHEGNAAGRVTRRARIERVAPRRAIARRKEQAMASESDAIFLKNCWYVAAWDHELIDGKLLARTILEEPVRALQGRERPGGRARRPLLPPRREAVEGPASRATASAACTTA